MRDEGFDMPPLISLTEDEAAYWEDEYQERAAMLEYEAGMTRPIAEAVARREIIERQGQIGVWEGAA